MVREYGWERWRANLGVGLLVTHGRGGGIEGNGGEGSCAPSTLGCTVGGSIPVLSGLLELLFYERHPGGRVLVLGLLSFVLLITQLFHNFGRVFESAFCAFFWKFFEFTYM